MEKAEELLKRFAQLEQERSKWEGWWQEVIDFCIPRLGSTQHEYQSGQREGRLAYDGTAINALELLADGLHGYLVSPSMQWFRLRMANRIFEEIPEVREWLQEVEKEMSTAFQRSNFYEAMSQYFRDGGSIGTATMYVEEDLEDDEIIFDVRHPKEVFIAENKHRKVDTLFRKFKMTARQAVQKFGLNTLSQPVQYSAENNPYSEFDFLHAVYPRDEFDPARVNNKNMPFASVWLHTSEKKIHKEGGFSTFPYQVWRYMQNSNETYGRSPASQALIDVMGLNTMNETLLGAAHMAVKPPWNIPAELKGQVRLYPNGMNYVKSKDDIIRPIVTGENYPIGADREERKRQAVREHFKVDFFLLLAQAQDSGQAKTATEIMELMGEKAAVLGAVIGRLNTECLNPITDRVFEILMSRPGSVIAQVPEALVGQHIEVDYLGPLAQAQKRLFATQGPKAALETIGRMAEASPDILDNFSFDELVVELAVQEGMPQKFIRPKEVVQAMRQQRAQAQQMAQEIQAGREVMAGVKDYAQADKASEGKISDTVNQFVERYAQ